MIELSEFKTYRAVFRPDHRALYETDFWHDLETHEVVQSKDEVKLFSPTVLVPVKQNACKHARTSAVKPHRCDGSVKEVTALVFDADQGTQADIDYCHRLLSETKISHVFYSTFSFDPTAPKQAYRLVVFIDRPIKPAEFRSVRAAVIQSFAVPCDPRSSAGLSHSYYYPAAKAGRPTRVLEWSGGPLQVDHFLGDLEPSTRTEYFALVDADSPKRIPSQSALAEECRRYIARRPDTANARLLAAMLRGAPLAGAGGRHAAVIALRGILCGMFTDVDPGCLYELARASLDTMSAEEDGRDFDLEFADEIEIYQDGLFGKDEANIEAQRPEGFLFPKLPEDSNVQVRLAEDLIAELHRRKPDAEVTKHIHSKGHLPQALINKAIWTLLANVPNYPLETYVRALAPIIRETTVGDNRLNQLVREAAYQMEASRRNETEFIRRQEGRS